jgi:hypothetical protein
MREDSVTNSLIPNGAKMTPNGRNRAAVVREYARSAIERGALPIREEIDPFEDGGICFNFSARGREVKIVLSEDGAVIYFITREFGCLHRSGIVTDTFTIGAAIAGLMHWIVDPAADLPTIGLELREDVAWEGSEANPRRSRTTLSGRLRAERRDDGTLMIEYPNSEHNGRIIIAPGDFADFMRLVGEDFVDLLERERAQHSGRVESQLLPDGPSGRGSHTFTVGWSATGAHDQISNDHALRLAIVDHEKRLLTIAIPTPYSGTKITRIHAVITLVDVPDKEGT